MCGCNDNSIVDKVLLGIGKYEYDKLRDKLNYAKYENLFLKFGRREEHTHKRHYYECCFCDYDRYRYRHKHHRNRKRRYY